jgi:hypothetical protein
MSYFILFPQYFIVVDAQIAAVRRLETLFNETGVPNDWTTDVSTPIYEQTDKYANSVRLDCIFVKLSGVLVEAGIKASLDTTYCVGVSLLMR